MLTLVSFLVAIGIIALVHELGHYLMAKKMGVGVKEFSIGFGPKIWSRRKHETEYSVRILPIAGFVDLVGMDPNEEVPEGEEGFNSKRPRARIAVLVSGAVMNIILAAVTFWFVFFVRGMEQPVPTVVNAVLSGKPAAAAGIKPGDRIVAINDKVVNDWFEMRTSIALHPEQNLTMKIDRGGQLLTVDVLPEISEEHNFGRIYIYPDYHYPRIGEVIADSPAQRAGLRSGDIIQSVSGNPIDDWREMQEVIRKNAGQTVEMVVIRDSQPVPVTIVPEAMKQEPRGFVKKIFSRFPGRKKTIPVGVIGILCNYISPVVEGVIPGSTAEKAGLRPGDTILKIAGKDVNSFNEILTICAQHQDKAVPIEMNRAGTVGEVTLNVPEDGVTGLEIDPPIIGNIRSGSRAESSGLPKDVWITAVNGKRIYSYSELQKTFSTTDSGKVTIDYTYHGRGDGTVSFELPASSERGDDALHTCGIYALGESIWVPVGFGRSFLKSLNKTWDTAVGMLYSLYLLVSGQIRGGVKNVMGPIGIANITGKYARSGIWVLINWVALLSTYIGLFNLVPFPALDGGRLSFIVIEAVSGYRVSSKIEETIHTVGLLFLFGLIILVSYFDVLRWLGF